MNISLRPAEMTAEQRAFFAFVDDLPTEVNAAMSEPLANLVRAKAGLVTANSNLHDALYKEALPQNPAIARRRVEAAQDQFERAFDSLGEQGLAVAAANLMELRAPPPANEVVAGIPAHVAAMARGATAGQNTVVAGAQDIPAPPQQFASQATPAQQSQHDSVMSLNG